MGPAFPIGKQVGRVHYASVAVSALCPFDARDGKVHEAQNCRGGCPFHV